MWCCSGLMSDTKAVDGDLHEVAGPFEGLSRRTRIKEGRTTVHIEFFDVSEIPDRCLAFAVIVARHRGRWIFCRHRDRETWEIPGGTREPGEAILETARRELWEETGAKDGEIRPICVYAVCRGGEKSYGLLSFAEIHRMAPLPGFEIETIRPFDRLPDQLTYPEIQPFLFRRVLADLQMPER